METSAFALTYLANCGVLVEAGAVRILIDALCAQESAFDRLPPAVEDALLDARPPYGHVDLLAFTHLHPDHFDLARTLRFMQRHPETQLLVPENFPAALAQPALRGRTRLMREEAAAVAGRLAVGGVLAEYLRVDHITFDAPCHYCLKLSLPGGEALVFTGDMDFAALPLLAERFALRGRRDTRVFCNPLLLGKPKWVQEVASWTPARVWIYHIPAQAIDQWGYRQLALSQAARAKALLPTLSLLLAPMQRL